jgi:hypothetical protein
MMLVRSAAESACSSFSPSGRFQTLTIQQDWGMRVFAVAPAFGALSRPASNTVRNRLRYATQMSAELEDTIAIASDR